MRAIRRNRRGLAPVAAALLACLATAPLRAEGVRRIRFCDELLLTLASDAPSRQQVIVSPRGVIEVDGVGGLPAVGMTPVALARTLEDVFAEAGRPLRAEVRVVRAEAPGCSVVTLPDPVRPEREAVPPVDLELETKPEMQPWPPLDLGAPLAADPP